MSNAVLLVCMVASLFAGVMIGANITPKSNVMSAGQPALATSDCPPVSQYPPVSQCPPCKACQECNVEESSASAGALAAAAGEVDAAAGAPQPEVITVVQSAPAPSGAFNPKKFYPLRHAENRFENWYNQHKVGKGVWKWTQYFPTWERHLAKFVEKSWAGQEVHMAELGIFSGGSLEMWQAVFGPGLRLWGVDIATVTKQYEQDDKSGRTRIFNMDQTNSASWDEFKKLVPKLDILIDDGLHLFSGQKATFDNMLGHIAPGGVFMTEDISDGRMPGARSSSAYPEKYLDYSFAKTRDLHVQKTGIQDTVDSIHYYPYLVVIEKRDEPLYPHGRGQPLAAIKHGTIWKPITHGVVKGEHASSR